MKFDNTYINLGEAFFQRVLPQKVANPKLLLWNTELANSLLITQHWQKDHRLLSQYFSGNDLPEGAQSIALAYSGHQFGHFNPQLGDGRAHLIGEVLDNANVRRDIQLKGSGQTAFSRRGDGKCALAPALREYIMSEALYALGVPTSRCLSVVATGEIINRGMAKAGAVVTRVAASHIRVGTFQYFASRGDTTSLKQLVNYTIERHFPSLNKLDEGQQNFEQRLLLFLENVIDKQITLIVEWLRIGFIHGVMNTDNTAICGETIDFGPCAMMGNYHEDSVFSSIDEYGRYAFGNQSKIAHWNMARLADCLMPLLVEYQLGLLGETTHDETTVKAQEQKALEKVEVLIHQFSAKFAIAYYEMYAKKLGLLDVSESHSSLIDELLAIMQSKHLDYTQTFHRLTLSLTDLDIREQLINDLGEWHSRWLTVLESNEDKMSTSAEKLLIAQTVMAKNNPVVIPRNHHVEAILSQCEDALDNSPEELTARGSIHGIIEEFITALRSPYQELEITRKYQDIPKDNDRYYQTFCGT